MKTRSAPRALVTMLALLVGVSWSARAQQGPVEEPWTPTDTGTVNPGMTPEEVVAVWGQPVIQREHGNWMFMYFRNGCEERCGTFDVVFFEGRQVVDAVVRGVGHTYTGVSSSPAGRTAEFTPPTRSGGTNEAPS